ncbi:hypothetical protein VE04_03974 [Pseudogymnoascus sp. 24MN13]|nr:hypothetical protein VE04_03974 [Pseudogymnoascus sp. 24MN13]
MPPARVKPSDVAAEAKKTYIPYIESKLSEQWPAHSYLVPESTRMRCDPPSQPSRCRMTAIEGDPVDVALELAITIDKPDGVALVNMANDKRPGGDWEAGVLAPEESICRRSNLVATLKRPAPNDNLCPANYPIPTTGGIYSPYVVIFRSGPDRYQLWQKFKTLPVISVPPVRRPKLDPTGLKYSFEQEKELMREKMRTVLRMAVWWGYSDLALGAFGCGPVFRNPTREVATMWRDLLYFDAEFRGHFSNVVFAFDPLDGTNPNPSPDKSSKKDASSKTSSKASGSSSKGKTKAKAASTHLEDMEIFRDVFDPAKMFPR